MHITKRKGPRIVPCGTPILNTEPEDYVSFIDRPGTCWILMSKISVVNIPIRSKLISERC